MPVTRLASHMQAMILARDEKSRRKALLKLLPMQRKDFAGLFTAMNGFPVVIRTLDPPERLLEFFASDQVAGTPQQKSEYLGRLARKTYAPALLKEFSRFWVEFENAESNQRTQQR